VLTLVTSKMFKAKSSDISSPNFFQNVDLLGGLEIGDLCVNPRRLSHFCVKIGGG